VMGHWLTALLVFIIAIIGLIPGLVTGGKTSSYVAFALCFFIFAFTGLSAH
jgi:cytochrome b561